MTDEPEGAAATRGEEARKALLDGDAARAIAALEALATDDPDDDATWLDLGLAYASVERWRDAAGALARAVDLDGTIAASRLAYGRALARSGKLDDAAFQLLQASRLAPDDGGVLRELGVVFYDKRLFDKAAQWLERAAKADPADARAPYALGLAHEGRRDIAQAIAAYCEAVRRDGRLVDARHTLADALASIGEHEAAIAELEAILAFDRSNEAVAHNRDVLARALADMRGRRLLGKHAREVEASALVQEGGLRVRGQAPTEDGGRVVRYGAPLVELDVAYGPAGDVRALTLVLTDPARAARAEDDTFQVTIITNEGRRGVVDYGTAATLTFLREALGCPLTHASELYARLLAERAPIEWGGVRLAFVTSPREGRPHDERHGILVSLQEQAG
jgi:tetratricopeptide (TPR) repeat protein